MARLKPLILFVLLGFVYPASQFGWVREGLLETELGPLHVLWAFALGFGGLAVLVREPRARMLPLGVLLAAGYAVSGALRLLGDPGAVDLPLALVLLWGLVVLGGVWFLALRGGRGLPGTPLSVIPVSNLARVKP